MKIKVDTYYDICCENCSRAWSTDFNARTRRMEDGGMGFYTDKALLIKSAYASGWKCKGGRTLCPECLEAENGPVKN